MKYTKEKYVVCDPEETVMLSTGTVHRLVPFRLASIKCFDKEKTAIGAMNLQKSTSEFDLKRCTKMVEMYGEGYWTQRNLSEAKKQVELSKNLIVKTIRITWEMI